ncbi:hypothetical protein SAMN04488543_2719 [Friedmanniella luteola]|uniref:Uncharacterized protein n=1 Tax=Friedmanniella luteola TaxID=546871 RepID=A0A1H1WF12_9ACTN|nr:hypothetical protein [Friedmanniella luteola]SDS95713.1 hypothetical protein SAMN04488543_2719 [Friedmanniella luteola]
MTSTAAARTTSTTATSAPTLWVRLYQLFSVLTALLVLVQFLTAGQLFPQGGPEQLHAAGAIVLHVVSGLAVVAAFVLWRTGGMTTAQAALPVVVFAFTFVQAATGGRTNLAVHVPGAMILTAGAVWQLVTALRPRR